MTRKIEEIITLILMQLDMRRKRKRGRKEKKKRKQKRRKEIEIEEEEEHGDNKFKANERGKLGRNNKNEVKRQKLKNRKKIAG